MDRVDCIVIGAGVIGLAIARAMAMAGRDVIIIEAENDIGSGTSSRNSEVIHAGIYYPPASLKARCCVQGREHLYRYCEQHAIAHQRCGKLIVATNSAQHAGLDRIAARAQANGVGDVQHLSGAQAQAMEPQLHCTAALFSPSTGIIDSHGLMTQLLADAEAAGASIAFQSEVVAARVGSGELVLDVVTRDGEALSLLASLVINAAGLAAPRIARHFKGLPEHFVPTAFYSKGNYFSLAAKAPFSTLIYPLPEAGGLGVHLTLDLAGQARFGPDVEWLAIADDREIDYSVDSHRADGFYASIRHYWPALADGALQPSYAGVRPKLTNGKDDVDFCIQGPATHGIPGLINLFGIESPGLTASLAIAAHVCDLAGVVDTRPATEGGRPEVK
jgi:L-2-hydroxyglutarate oxidase LhgO